MNIIDHIEPVCYARGESVALLECSVKETTAFAHSKIHHRFKYLSEQLENISQNLPLRRINGGVIVSIHLERSANFVICILSALKIHGTFIPLDPKLPKGRILEVLNDAQCNFIIISESMMEFVDYYIDLDIYLGVIDSFSSLSHVLFRGSQVFPSESGSHTRHIDIVSCHNKENTSTEKIVIPRNRIAYIIYTSGSSGKPKGVCISHDSLFNVLVWFCQELQSDSTSAMLSFSSFLFDISILEILLPLLVGGTIVLATEDLNRNPQMVHQLIQSHSITIVQCTPTTVDMLLMNAPEEFIEHPCWRNVDLLVSKHRGGWRAYRSAFVMR